jgi:hypothetical protein
MKNKLNWTTTGATTDKALYLCIMRDLKAYCAKGYCEVAVAVCHFVELPNTFIRRELARMGKAEDTFTVDWESASSVYVFLHSFISIVVGLNVCFFSKSDFEAAYWEFTQYIHKNKIKQDEHI